MDACSDKGKCHFLHVSATSTALAHGLLHSLGPSDPWRITLVKMFK